LRHRYAFGRAGGKNQYCQQPQKNQPTHVNLPRLSPITLYGVTEFPP
jgi:hypothetical protein